MPVPNTRSLNVPKTTGTQKFIISSKRCFSSFIHDSWARQRQTNDSGVGMTADIAGSQSYLRYPAIGRISLAEFLDISVFAGTFLVTMEPAAKKSQTTMSQYISAEIVV
jgi:hypothetical protein